MLLSQLGDLVDLLDGYVLSKREIIEGWIALQRKNHRFTHARISSLRRESEIEVEFHISRHFDDTTFNYQNVWTFLCNSHRYITWTSNVTNDASRL